MQPDFDAKRNAGGSIDIDFYRRRAVRWRRKARTALIHRLVTHFARAVRVSIPALLRPRLRRTAARTPRPA